MLVCPKCGAAAEKTEKGAATQWRCPEGCGMLYLRKCVACDVRFGCLITRGCDWHDHHCSPRHLNGRKGGERTAEMYESGDLYREPTEIERYERGFEMLHGDMD